MRRAGIGVASFFTIVGILAAAWLSQAAQGNSPTTAGPAAAGTSIVPKQWHTTARRSAPWDQNAPELADAVIPYLPGKAAGSSAGSTVFLAGKSGGSLRVDGEPAVEGVRLKIVPPVQAGTYAGTATVGPDSDVDLTIDVADAWPWPLVTLLLGILFALAVQHEVGVMRRVIPLEQRQAERRAAFLTAIVSFDEATKNRYAEATATLRAAWLAADAALVRRLRTLARETLTLDPKDPDYVDAERESRRLDGVTAILSRLPAELQALNDQLGKLEIPAMSRSHWAAPFDLDDDGARTQPVLPAFIFENIERFGPRLVLSIDTITLLEGQMGQVSAMADAWMEWISDLGHWEALLQALSEAEDMSSSDRAVLDEARRLATKVRWDLWRATGPADLAARGYPADRLTLEGKVASLSRFLYHVSAKPLDLNAPAQFSLFTPALTLARVVGIVAPGESSVAAFEARWLAVRGRVGYTLAFFAVLAALLYAGFAALYVGKPFGAPTDYLAAFFWGSSAKIGLDITANALASFRVPAHAAS